MSDSRPAARLMERALETLGSTRMTSVISLTAIGLAFTSRFIRALMGWPALGAGLTVLVLIACASLFARRAELEWRGLLPISLLVFLGWSAMSVLWTDYQWATASGIAYQLAFAILGIYVALTRDLIQIIRSVGDVIRLSLVLSFALEVFAGLLIDQPIHFLGIEGNLGIAQPIQGIFGIRNQLGLVALIGLITFTTELLTRSVPRALAVFSLSLSALGLLLTRSPVILGATIAAVATALAMYGLRHLAPSARRVAQFSLLGLTVIGLGVAWAFRSPIIASLNAGSEFEVRYELWRSVLNFVSIRPLEGWGWVGLWRADLPPYLAINDASGHAHASALNAFVDVMIQGGIVGLFCFLVLFGLALVRSWLLAANQRSVVYVWPAIVLVALLVTSLAESAVLVEYGWLLFVLCSVAAAHRLSWRSNYEADPGIMQMPSRGRGDA